MEDLIINRIVKDVSELEGVRGILISTPDGVPIVKKVEKENAEEIGTICVTLKVTGEELLKSMKLGEFNEAVLECEKYKLLVLPYKDFVIGIIVDKKASLYLIKRGLSPILEESKLIEEAE